MGCEPLYIRASKDLLGSCNDEKQLQHLLQKTNGSSNLNGCAGFLPQEILVKNRITGRNVLAGRPFLCSAFRGPIRKNKIKLRTPPPYINIAARNGSKVTLSPATTALLHFLPPVFGASDIPLLYTINSTVNLLKCLLRFSLLHPVKEGLNK